ncbi:MAG: glycoside hydrolase family 57 protein [Paludibacteraceae bacterium]|nr:glycoside hydrolase family 57 protein [Paludibacteraceae bacterium]
MKKICFYFQVHSPYVLRRYRFFEVGNDHYYYDDFATEDKIRELAEKSYLPANAIILDIIRKSEGNFKCAFSISGPTIEQLEMYAPEVIDSFKELADTGQVEFLAEPYGHSLSSMYNDKEFEIQVKKHADKIKELFGKKPTAFLNTELIYSDEMAEKIASLGYNTILLEGAKHVLGWKSPNYVYSHPYLPKVRLLTRNFPMSNHIPFQFSDTSWSEYPMTADKFIQWIVDAPQEEELFNIWLGYESFGIIQKDYTGIFEFLKALPIQAFKRGIGFTTPSEAAKATPIAPIAVGHLISWSGEEKDVTSWTGNQLQEEALNKLYSVAERVNLCKEKALKHDWLMIQCTDYLRYMSFKNAWGSTFDSPYDAFTNYMNILADFLLRVDAEYPTSIENEELNELLKTINDQEKTIGQLEGEIKQLKKKQSKKQ